LNLERRRTLPFGRKTAAVLIEDGAFIGMSCLVLKGVRIGKDCIAVARSVITRDVPSNAIVAGNPAMRISEKSGTGAVEIKCA
jgi:acetyltransferase-like isoleucine patch superfamily enzyme